MNFEANTSDVATKATCKCKDVYFDMTEILGLASQLIELAVHKMAQVSKLRENLTILSNKFAVSQKKVTLLKDKATGLKNLSDMYRRMISTGFPEQKQAQNQGIILTPKLHKENTAQIVASTTQIKYHSPRAISTVGRPLIFKSIRSKPTELTEQQ